MSYQMFHIIKNIPTKIQSYFLSKTKIWRDSRNKTKIFFKHFIEKKLHCFLSSFFMQINTYNNLRFKQNMFGNSST